MNTSNFTVDDEYRLKLDIKRQIEDEQKESITKNGLKDFSKIAKYMHGLHQYMDRGLIHAHLDFEPIATAIANKRPFTIVSGKNPSGSLHLGHLATFKMLLEFQKLGADVIIPLSADESLVENKGKTIKEAEHIAKAIVIPQVIAMGFDLSKTKILLETQYPEMYRIACTFGHYVGVNQLTSAFGKQSASTASQTFYRGAVQLATILLPQLAELGGNKNVLVPVSADQHPYILLARDVANKMGMVPPSEVVIPFLQSHKDPLTKMSSSKPETSIYLSDSAEVVRSKINKAYTGAVSSLEGHTRLGAIPEIDSCFQILRYHHPDSKFVDGVYSEYKRGMLKASELKGITVEFVNSLLRNLQTRAKAVSPETIRDVLFDVRVESI